MCVQQHGVVGVGGVLQRAGVAERDVGRESFSFTLGLRSEQSPYSGTLAAIAYVLRHIPNGPKRLAVLTTNKAATQSIAKPQQQSGQEFIRCIYESTEDLRNRDVSTSIIWLPSESDVGLLSAARKEAKEATRDGAIPERQFPRMLSTTFNTEKRKLQAKRCLPDAVGKHSKSIDTALPGDHTRKIYETLPWNERTVLA